MTKWILLVVFALAAIAEARPGGGNTSSGGSRTRSSSSSSSRSYTPSSSSRSSSSSSSSSSRPSSSSSSSRPYSSSSSSGGSYSSDSFDDGTAASVGKWIFGGLFGGVMVVGGVVFLRNRRDSDSVTVHAPPVVVDLADLRRKDPAFSLPMFENFVFELVGAVHGNRNDPQLRDFQRYLSPAVIEHLAGRETVAYIPVIGAIRVQDHSEISGDRDQLSVEVEATLFSNKKPRNVVEMWKFVRARDQVTPMPSTSPRTARCPNCGAITDANRPNCAHCHRPIEPAFNWTVDRMWVISDDSTRASLTGTVPEQGNQLLTIVDPAVDQRMKLITVSDPEVTSETVKARVNRVYQELNTAWNANDLTPVRGLVTGSLRNYLQYWLRAYEGQRLRNQITRASIEKIELAKVTRDLYYDAITVRIFATGYDFTTDADNDVVGGSNNQFRPYTEYWTFIRSATRTGKVNDTTACPNCGAPQSISDAGACTHCNAVIETGAFDWVLSKIEQDDSYGG